MVPRPPQAFTLVELLVVVAILGLLALLGMGALAGSRARAEQVGSAANLRQWAVALSACVAGQEGDLPRRGQGVQPVFQLDRPEDWFNALPPYLGLPGYGELVRNGRRPRAGERSIYVRPGAKDPGGTAFLSYGMNMNLSPWNQPAPTKFAALERPESTVFMAETPGPYSSTYPSARAYSCQAPHEGHGLVLFLDGHLGLFSGAYLGVNQGDPGHEDLRWLTGTPSDTQAANY